MSNTILEQLSQAPPETALKTRKQAGRELTYLEGWYVIETMNRIFGSLCWERGFAGKGLYEVYRQEIEIPQRGVRYDISILCEYRVRVKNAVSEYLEIQDVGYGSGQSYNGYADAFESAAKEAVTDALKRCCRSFGNALGNCLYDKEWLRGHDEAEQEKPKEQPKPLVDLRKLKAKAGMEWLAAFDGPDSAIAEIVKTKQMTPQAEEYIRSFYTVPDENTPDGTT